MDFIAFFAILFGSLIFLGIFCFFCWVFSDEIIGSCPRPRLSPANWRAKPSSSPDILRLDESDPPYNIALGLVRSTVLLSSISYSSRQMFMREFIELSCSFHHGMPLEQFRTMALRIEDMMEAHCNTTVSYQELCKKVLEEYRTLGSIHTLETLVENWLSQHQKRKLENTVFTKDQDGAAGESINDGSDVPAVQVQLEVAGIQSAPGVGVVDVLPSYSAPEIDSIDESRYMEWTHSDIIRWIITLDDGRFFHYERQLKTTIAEEEVDGASLRDVDISDLKRWGIVKLKDFKYLQKEIDRLVAGAQIQSAAPELVSDSNLLYANEGASSITGRDHVTNM